MLLLAPVRLAAAGFLSLSIVLAGGAAHAHGDHDRAERMSRTYDAGLAVPLLSSPNVRLAAARPGSAGISGCFLHSAPYFVTVGPRRRDASSTSATPLARARSGRCRARSSRTRR